MKNKNQEEKLCSFYASDYHFEMISLPYIEKEISNKNQIIILTENDLKDTVQKVLSRTNLKEEEKQKIFEIGWEKSDREKINKIKENSQNAQKTTIFIKGDTQYIEEMEEKLKEINKNNVKTIHCYPIEKSNKNMSSIIKQYDGVLNTIGKINI